MPSVFVLHKYSFSNNLGDRMENMEDQDLRKEDHVELLLEL